MKMVRYGEGGGSGDAAARRATRWFRRHAAAPPPDVSTRQSGLCPAQMPEVPTSGARKQPTRSSPDAETDAANARRRPCRPRLLTPARRPANEECADGARTPPPDARPFLRRRSCLCLPMPLLSLLSPPSLCLLPTAEGSGGRKQTW